MRSPRCCMASLDLRHASLSVSIKPDFRKYLKFKWRGQLYFYTCFPNGLCHCLRYFTKLTKPGYAKLRAQLFFSTSFIDDCYVQGNTFEECAQNVHQTVKVFQSLGFVIHEGKSVLIPFKRLKYLRFWLDSDKMTVTLPAEKIRK